MKLIETKLKEVKIICPEVMKDDRGYFFESYNYKKFIENINFVQDNESLSKYGVLRGLHYQKKPYGQSKLVRVIKGKIQDVVVDIRPKSKTYKKYLSVELSDENKYQLFVPDGFAHGFLILSDEAIISYKVDCYYNMKADLGYRFNDPSFNIKWVIDDKEIILSKKDENLPFLK